jgi:hypothetical protein
MLKGATLDLGDSGGGVPHRLDLDINNARLCDIYTTEDYQDLSSLTEEQQRIVKNRGEGNKINLNGRQIFSGSRPTEFFSPVSILDPYVISQNGFSYPGFKLGSPANDCLFTDWWKAWGGLDIAGNGSILIPPIFNPASGGLQRNVFSDDPSGRFMRLNTPIGGSTGVDPDVHSRTSPMTLATIATYTSSASSEVSAITDSDAIKLKIGARVQATGLPSPTTNTTIISRIVHNGTNNNSIFLIDSETGGNAVVSATGNLTIDMSGNSGVSHQLDAMQRTLGDTGARATGVGASDSGANLPDGVFTNGRIDNFVNSRVSQTNAYNVAFDNSANGNYKTSGTGNGDGQTYPISNQRKSYLIL